MNSAFAVRLRYAAAVIGTAVLVALIVVGCSSGSASRGSSASAVGSGEISWESAGGHVGETVSVRGPVISATYAVTSKGSPTFLNVGQDYPSSGRFTVVIFGQARAAFPGAPEDTYRGKTIVVHGAVQLYKGIPQIIATSPSEITVID